VIEDESGDITKIPNWHACVNGGKVRETETHEAAIWNWYCAAYIGRLLQSPAARLIDKFTT